LDIDGSYTTLDVPGATNSDAYGVNDAGQLVGEYRDFGSASHGFLLDVDGSYTMLDVAGATDTFVYGINNAGQLVGSYIEVGGRVLGFLATPN
jgi:hypothetical protein